MRRNPFALLAALAVLSIFGIGDALAQLPANLCPPPGRWVSGGGGMMCQCPDGSFYGIGQPCRTKQRQQGTPSQPISRSEAQINERQARAPVLNRTTGRMEQRRGNTVVARNGRKIWFHPPIYAGPVYVHIENVGFVRMDDRYEKYIYPALVSGIAERIEDAVALIEGSAIMQGMMEMEETDGD